MKREKEILEYLYINKNPVRVVKLVDDIGAIKAQIVTALIAMRKAGSITCTNNHQYSISDRGRNKCVIEYGLDESDILKTDSLDSAGEIKEVVMEEKDNLDAAFNKLESDLKTKSFDNVDLKIGVLDRLSGLMDESISEVLDLIIIDLKSA